MVCLHDAGGNGNDFAELLDELAIDQSPLSFDMPGHGRSAGLDSLGSVPAMAAHTRALLEGFGLTGVILVGEGLGGAVALETAMLDADSAAGTSLVAGVVLIGQVATVFDVSREIESLSAITAGRARREFDRTGYAPETDRAVYGKAFGEWVKTDPRATLGDRRGQADWSVGERRLAVPAMVVVGEHQDVDETETANALAAALGSVAVTLEAAGRHGVIEQPVALAALIGTFIGGLV